jgi:hypothetical protein
MYLYSLRIFILWLALYGSTVFAGTNYEIEGVVIKEGKTFTGLWINAGTTRQQFLHLDFSASELGDKDVVAKIVHPLRVTLCGQYDEASITRTSRGRVVWVRALLPSRKPKLYDRLPQDFKSPCQKP